MTVVTAPSGCGKSTLLYLLGLLLTPTEGQVVWDSQIVSALDDRARSKVRAVGIGFVFQDAALDTTRSVSDNILEGGLYAGLGRAQARVRTAELMRRFQVDLRADHLPGEISGGQAQRVALCRALLKQPTLILADEPTGNLDERSAAIVWDALASAAHRDGAVVVVATHDRHRVAKADLTLDLGTYGGS
jgi:ABC-type lipoprotein export system ATPase subunit